MAETTRIQKGLLFAGVIVALAIFGPLAKGATKTVPAADLPPLIAAVRDGDVEKVNALLDSGADIRVTTDEGWTVLHWAAVVRGTKTAEVLIKNKADPNARDKDGWTPLHVAAQWRSQRVAELLLANGADPKAKDNSGRTPLYLAYTPPPSWYIAQVLISHGADVNAETEKGFRPLDAAKEWSTKADIKMLEGKGAKQRFWRTGWGQNLKELGVVAGIILVIWLIVVLVGYVADRRRKKEPQVSIPAGAAEPARAPAVVYFHGMGKVDGALVGGPALHRAVYGNNLTEAANLITAGAKVEEHESVFGWTPLHIAGAIGNEEMLALLIKNGANVNSVDLLGHTALHWAAIAGAQRAVSILLDKGASVSVSDLNGATPLHVAVRFKCDIVNELVRSGMAANIECVSAALAAAGYASSYRASRNHSERVNVSADVAELLLARGAPLEAADTHGQTPLHLAALCGDVRLVDLLIQKGADITRVTKNGSTVMHFAVIGEDEGIVKFLIQKGFPLDIADANGLRPVEVASKEIARILIGHGARHDVFTAVMLEDINVLDALVGADPQIAKSIDARGRMPLHCAIESGASPEVLDWLIKHGADVNAQDSSGRSPVDVALEHKPRLDTLKLLVEAGADVEAAMAGTSMSSWRFDDAAEYWRTVTYLRSRVSAAKAPCVNG